MKIAMGVEYDGSQFHGWQIQEGTRTVQEELEKGLSKVADHPVRVHCAGRTDTGVHGLGQVVHFDTEAERPMRSWVLGGNVNMARDVSINWAQPVPEDFHARFSARARSYRYIIANRHTRSAIHRYHATWFHKPLDEARMQQGADHLLGEHDFTSFRAVACQAHSPVRTLYHLTVSREGDYLYIDVRANAFLHHMVRNIAGVLMTVGCGEAEPDWVGEVLEHRDRTQGGITARPEGLYLVKVEYADFDLPKSPGLPRLG